VIPLAALIWIVGTLALGALAGVIILGATWTLVVAGVL
jgi:hypothetical protein